MMLGMGLAECAGLFAVMIRALLRGAHRRRKYILVTPE